MVNCLQNILNMNECNKVRMSEQKNVHVKERNENELTKERNENQNKRMNV